MLQPDCSVFKILYCKFEFQQTAYFGSITKYITDETVAGICFVVLFLILWIVLECSTKYVLREDIKKYSEEFKKICDEANDEVAFNVWKTKMDKIIG